MTGPILVGDVTLGGFTVKNQAFISAPGSNATILGDNGILGVGPPRLSYTVDQLRNKKSKFDRSSFLAKVCLDSFRSFIV